MKHILFTTMALTFWVMMPGCQSKTNSNQTEMKDQTEDTVQAADEETTSAPSSEQRASPLIKESGTVDGVNIEIAYGSPSVKNRTIWGDLVAYDKVWRTGANEATVVTFGQDVLIEGKPLPAGKYGLFTIPSASSWTVIFNKVWNQWGAYEYDAKKDVLRVIAEPEMVAESKEQLEITIEDAEGAGGSIVLRWEKLRLPIEVQAK